jgi:uncharacterized membrane protein YdjX (TVP38/TMEM64 family)
MDKILNVSRLQSLGKFSVLVASLIAFVLIPFILWGEQMDEHTPKLLQSPTAKWSIALIGVGLLAFDVILPVPSSVISIGLCFLLGPFYGALAVFIGMTSSFSLGYIIGRLLPVTYLRHWIGHEAWDTVSFKSRPINFAWIVITRPIPILAEVTAILAGSLHLPLIPTFASASLSSILVSIAYGAASLPGIRQTDSSLAILVISVACLPVLTWIAFRLIQRTILRLPK